MPEAYLGNARKNLRFNAIGAIRSPIEDKLNITLEKTLAKTVNLCCPSRRNSTSPFTRLFESNGLLEPNGLQAYSSAFLALSNNILPIGILVKTDATNFLWSSSSFHTNCL